MSGRINLPVLGAQPSGNPGVGRVWFYALSTDQRPYYMLSDGIPRTFGVVDHSALNLDDGTNPHNTTKSDVGLSNVPNVDATQRANHTGTQLANTISDFDAALANYLDRTLEQDNSEQVNTTTTFADRHNFNVNPNHTAQYKISIDYTWAYDEGTTDFIAELLIDGVVVREHQQEPKETGGSDGGAGTDQRHMANMGYKHDATSGTPFNVQMRFRSSTGGVEATIRDSIITVERFI